MLYFLWGVLLSVAGTELLRYHIVTRGCENEEKTQQELSELTAKVVKLFYEGANFSYDGSSGGKISIYFNNDKAEGREILYRNLWKKNRKFFESETGVIETEEEREGEKIFISSFGRDTNVLERGLKQAIKKILGKRETRGKIFCVDELRVDYSTGQIRGYFLIK